MSENPSKKIIENLKKKWNIKDDAQWDKSMKDAGTNQNEMEDLVKDFNESDIEYFTANGRNIASLVLDTRDDKKIAKNQQSPNKTTAQEKPKKLTNAAYIIKAAKRIRNELLSNTKSASKAVQTFASSMYNKAKSSKKGRG
ncbi:MAG: hypothetical protein P8P83_05190 [Rickettsiaceae bacterium]|nr:hypothetical protein [Rickettsiaceae bacterium]